MIKLLSDKKSVFNQFMLELRDENIQKDSMRFRRNLERMGEIMAYEISQTMNFELREVTTPLGIADVYAPNNDVVLATILRAGLPLHNGLLNYFDCAENAFISAYRKYSKDGAFNIQFEHISSPHIEDKILIISDPMLATGASMVLAYQALLEQGTPQHTHIVTLIASKEGTEYVTKRLPMKNVTLWIGALDDELTVKSYIVPGLGDAGDLAYGVKE